MNSSLYPEKGKKGGPLKPGRFPCFGGGCMNQPLLHHQIIKLSKDNTTRGGFNGSYDLGGETGNEIDAISFEVVCEKNGGLGAGLFSISLKLQRSIHS